MYFLDEDAIPQISTQINIPLSEIHTRPLNRLRLENKLTVLNKILCCTNFLNEHDIAIINYRHMKNVSYYMRHYLMIA